MDIDKLYIDTNNDGIIVNINCLTYDGYSHTILDNPNELYLNGEKVSSYKIDRSTIKFLDEKEDHTSILLSAIIGSFKKNPNIANSISAYEYSIKNLKDNYELFIKSSFLLYFVDYIEGRLDGELDKNKEKRLYNFYNIHNNFKRLTIPELEKERCLSFINYIKTILSTVCPNICCYDLQILYIILSFIRTTYLAKNTHVIDIFNDYLLKPTIKLHIINYSCSNKIDADSYAYSFGLVECVDKCKGILPDDIVENIKSHVCWLNVFHFTNHNYTNKREKPSEKYIRCLDLILNMKRTCNFDKNNCLYWIIELCVNELRINPL